MSLDKDIEALTHSHVYLGARHDENARRTLWVVALTAAMMVAEIIAGLVFNSMALLADGVHMATHAGALGIAVIAYAYAKRHARSGRYSFGTGKVGDLAGFASALILAMVSVGIAVESAARLVDPTAVAFGEAAVMATIGLAVNLVSALLLGHGRDHHGHDREHDQGHGQDNNFRSAYLHVLTDALTSVLAILALLGGYYFGWGWLDPAIGIVGAAVIAAWSWSLLRDTALVLLDATDAALETRIREAVEGPGDARIGDLHVWRVGPGAYAAIVSVAGITRETVRERVAPVHEVEHLTIDIR
jgi:cation diffusion facilitator family transporter